MSACTQLTTTSTPRPIVSPVDGRPVADSRDVAAFFGKTHRSVLQTIDTAIAAEPDLALHDLMQGSYTVPETGPQRHRRFLLTRDGFSLIAMGFTGATALKWKRAYIAAFNAMEAELRNRPVATPGINVRDPAQLTAITLQLIQVNQEQARELTVIRGALASSETQVELQAPKVAAFEDLMDDRGLCSLSNVARLLDAPQAKFFAWLRKRGFVFDQGDSVLPEGKLRKQGYFRVKLIKLGRNKHVEQTLATRDGLMFLRTRWLVSDERKTLELAGVSPQARLPGV